MAKLECAVANRQRDLAEKLPRVCAAGGRYVEMLRRRPPQYSCG